MGRSIDVQLHLCGICLVCGACSCSVDFITCGKLYIGWSDLLCSSYRFYLRASIKLADLCGVLTVVLTSYWSAVLRGV